MKKFEVDISVVAAATLTVKAESEDEAKEIALARIDAGRVGKSFRRDLLENAFGDGSAVAIDGIREVMSPNRAKKEKDACTELRRYHGIVEIFFRDGIKMVHHDCSYEFDHDGREGTVKIYSYGSAWTIPARRDPMVGYGAAWNAIDDKVCGGIDIYDDVSCSKELRNVRKHAEIYADEIEDAEPGTYALLVGRKP